MQNEKKYTINLYGSYDQNDQLCPQQTLEREFDYFMVNGFLIHEVTRIQRI